MDVASLSLYYNSYPKERKMAAKKNNEQLMDCPVGRFFVDFEGCMGRKSKFFKHMTRSKVEFLKGIRSVLDDRIDHYEKKGSKKNGKKMTKIKID
jgi:hypothetical protein